MVTVVQLVEHQFVVLVVAGSNPVGHPSYKGFSFERPFFIIMAPWRNWIAFLISAQAVIGSNPIGVTLLKPYLYW